MSDPEEAEMVAWQHPEPEQQPQQPQQPQQQQPQQPPSSTPEEEDDEDEDEDEDLNYYYYSYNEETCEGGAVGQLNNSEDPEYVTYVCFDREEAEKYLAECATKQRASEPPAPAVPASSSAPSAPSAVVAPPPPVAGSSVVCQVCYGVFPFEHFSRLSTCQHLFCRTCWDAHFEAQVKRGCSTGLTCMSTGCESSAPESFVTAHLRNNATSAKFSRLAFQEYVRAHPQLRFCPGYSCKTIIKAEKPCAKKCVCSTCKVVFCFLCSGDYHAPTDCDTIRLWLTKCADDSETANYISAHTKDCPKCNICIEKNGGCNHMQCYNCKHDFCWMCLGDWKSHGSEYYECSRYKENPNIAHESAHAQAREALKKYLHYFERWENHSKSMKLEKVTLEKIRTRITAKVMEGSGTWIDWQYLLDASALLAKCRYTLQYTYPYAYYMEASPRKELFEYQQAQLEAEIENLSWKVEHAESTDRGDLENQIDIAEKRRTSLLKDFLHC